MSLLARRRSLLGAPTRPPPRRPRHGAGGQRPSPGAVRPGSAAAAPWFKEQIQTGARAAQEPAFCAIFQRPVDPRRLRNLRGSAACTPGPVRPRPSPRPAQAAHGPVADAARPAGGRYTYNIVKEVEARRRNPTEAQQRIMSLLQQEHVQKAAHKSV